MQILFIDWQHNIYAPFAEQIFIVNVYDTKKKKTLTWSEEKGLHLWIFFRPKQTK